MDWALLCFGFLRQSCYCCIQECIDGADPLKAESVRKVLRIAVRRASSLPDDVADGPVVCIDRQTAAMAQQPTYADASVATDATSGTACAVNFIGRVLLSPCFSVN